MSRGADTKVCIEYIYIYIYSQIVHILVVCTSSEIKECGMIVKIVLIFIVFMYYFTCISFAIRPSGRKSAIKLID